MKNIFIDIDGTILNSSGQATKRTLDALSNLKSHNIDWFVCTGRSRQLCKEIVGTLKPSRYLISATGTDIFDLKENRIIYQKFLPIRSVIKIFEIAKKNNLISWFENGDSSYTNMTTDKNPGTIEIHENYVDFFKHHRVTQIVLKHKNFETMNNVRNEILKLKNVAFVAQSERFTNQNAQEYPSCSTYLNVTALHQSKGNGVKKLCKYLNIPLSTTICIGDSDNDISMIKIADLGLAMGNSRESVKPYADKILKTNDEDGVAEFLEQNFLKNKTTF